MICANPACKKEFLPNRKDNIYCSSKCRGEVWKTKPKLEELPMPQPKQVLLKERNYAPPVALDVSAQFVIDSLKEEKSELKERNKKLDDLVEKLKSEKTDLEKQLAQVEQEVNKKPTALEGLFSNPERLEGVLQSVPNILLALKEVFNNNPSAPQIDGTPQTANHPLFVWLSQQPEDIQKLFGQLINNITRYQPAQLRPILSNILTQTLRQTG
jgi:DNA repair exonuclease SbcCD ATPase subunit